MTEFKMCADVHVNPGDLFEIGPHKLLCGDCGDRQDVEAVLGGETISMVMTSPPYLNQRSYEAPDFDWYALMRRWTANVRSHEECQVLVNLGMVHQPNGWVPYWERWLQDAVGMGYKRTGMYVWNKINPTPGSLIDRLRYDYELIFHIAVKPRKSIAWQKGSEYDRNVIRTTLMRGKNGLKEMRKSPYKPAANKQSYATYRGPVHNNQSAFDHPAVYPVEMPLYYMRSFAREGELIFEPFAGSGSTIIAAERMQARCYAIEKNPKYARAALMRLQNAMPYHRLKKIDFARTASAI